MKLMPIFTWTYVTQFFMNSYVYCLQSHPLAPFYTPTKFAVPQIPQWMSIHISKIMNFTLLGIQRPGQGSNVPSFALRQVKHTCLTYLQHIDNTLRKFMFWHSGAPERVKTALWTQVPCSYISCTPCRPWAHSGYLNSDMPLNHSQTMSARCAWNIWTWHLGPYAVFSLSGASLCQKTNFLRALSMCCRHVRQVCLTCLRAKLGTFEPWPGLQGPNSLKFMIIDIGIDIHWEIWRMANFVGI